MASARYADIASRPTEFLDFTSLTLEEFQILLPPFEAAFQAHMAVWRFDGTPRTTRRFTVYKNCPLPTPEDRLFFLLTYLKTYTLQVVHGRLFGMPQCTANQWIHVLLSLLLTTLRTLGDAPTRSLAALAQRLGVTVGEAAAVVTPLEEEALVVTPLPEAPAPAAAVPVAPAAASPLLPMTARHGASSAPKTLLNRKTVRAARKKITRSKTSSWSMPPSPSSCSATRTAATSMISVLPRRPRIRCPLEASCYRIWVFWRSPCPRWRCSCPRRNPAVRN